MHYYFCPICGSKLVEKAAGDDGKVPFCEHCYKYWFDTFSNCIIVMIYNEFNEIVLCKQNYLSDIYYNFTSGYMTPGENAEDSTYREVKEELGLEIQKLDSIGTFWFEEKDMLMHAFIAYVPKAKLTISSEIDEAKWIFYREVPKLIFPDKPGNAMWHMYRAFLKQNKLDQI